MDLNGSVPAKTQQRNSSALTLTLDKGGNPLKAYSHGLPSVGLRNECELSGLSRNSRTGNFNFQRSWVEGTWKNER